MRSLLLALAVAGCSNITANEEGVGELLLLLPSPAEVEAGQTIALKGVAVSPDGDTLNVPIYWRALDSTIAVDSVAAQLTGLIPGQTGRVVARSGSLYSPTATFSVLFPADTLYAVSPDTQTVGAGTPGSGALLVQFDAGDPPEPVVGRRVVYQVVEPVFASPEDRSVEFAGGRLVTSLVSGPTGSPAGLSLLRVDGRTAPDSAIVTASAWHPGGAVIAGTPVRFIIRFEP